MGKFAPNAMLDAGLDYIALSTKLCVCSAQPATYAEATVTYMLAEIVIDSGDFTKADGDTSGRKVTVASASGEVTNSGEADHLALVSTGDSTLRFVTTCDALQLVASSAIVVPAFDIEIADPA